MLRIIFKRYNFTARIILGIILFFLSIIMTGFIEGMFSYKAYFPFTGMILLLLSSWYLYTLDNQNLDQLGLNFNFRNYKFLLFGFILGIFALFIATFLKHLITDQSIHFNGSFNTVTLLIGLYYIFPNVVVEELLYRGYLFKKVINHSNVIIANILFSTAFTLVHVLDTQILSNLGAIIIMSVTIPIGHLLFATSLLKFKTLLFPIGLHLGNNIATKHILTGLHEKQSLFYESGNGTFETWFSFITFIILWNGFYLLLTYVIWKWPMKPIPKN